MDAAYADGRRKKVYSLIEPYARSAVLKMFGENAASPNVCPGEKACDVWQSAAGGDEEAKTRKACTKCDLLPTKLTGGKLDQVFKGLVMTAMEIRTEKIAGYPRADWLMRYVEFRVFVVVEELIDERNRITMLENNFLMKGVLGVARG